MPNEAVGADRPADGNTLVGGIEVARARFPAAELPATPPPGTISSQLIQDFVRRALEV